MKKITLLAAIFIIAAVSSFAQKTGLYTENKTFAGEDRAFTIYAPADYSPDSTYRLMICLHGAQDNSQNYMNAIINIVQWNKLFPNTIFICPDGGDDPARDYFAPAGDEAVVDSARNYAISVYPNIDENNVVLQGFSLGGRSALKLGLETPERYKGLILHTPAIQGPKELLDMQYYSLHYKWENASKIPITITCGTQDAYINIVPKILPNLIKNGGIVDYAAFNMQHSIPPNSQTVKMMNFLYNYPVEGVDLHMVPFEMQFYTYEHSYKLKIPIWSRGSTNVTSVKFSITPKRGGESFEATYNGDMKPYNYAELELPEQVLLPGASEFDVAIKEINGVAPTDPQVTKVVPFIINYLTPKNLPLSQGFENENFPVDDWRVLTSNSMIPWEFDTLNTKEGVRAAGIINWAFTYDNQGLPESIESPILKLNTVENPAVAFDYQFNYHYYDGTKTPGSGRLSDTLVIEVSKDLGATWTEVYRNSGANLATFPEPILNPIDINSAFFMPKKADWKTVLVDLNQFKDAEQALVKFSIVSGMGGCFYIDNIRFDEKSNIGTRDLPKALAAQLSPNPAVDATELSFSLSNGGPTRIEIVELSGAAVATYDAGVLPSGENRLQLNTSALSPGLYFVKALCGTEIITAKLNVIGK